MRNLRNLTLELHTPGIIKGLRTWTHLRELSLKFHVADVPPEKLVLLASFTNVASLDMHFKEYPGKATLHAVPECLPIKLTSLQMQWTSYVSYFVILKHYKTKCFPTAMEKEANELAQSLSRVPHSYHCTDAEMLEPDIFHEDICFLDRLVRLCFTRT